ncbi:THO complex subunit 4B [Zancudomyces culisetae]|uniref:THO complex subunit 4A n=1 Tax=Zancudomyces culisetae TaxID=1213189 RepID=A0A1R1PD35_ZANCU|nr:THO complex subunit 4A [Zancudomyces culisetae]OMH81815.1 THO complex subunit 4B [Zancudomyces culisetae]|eukprot:OMH78782.1 THO complex subunit 4A [Zancudomyces culisetae]
MSTNLDKSLDEIITQNRSQRGGGPRRRGGPREGRIGKRSSPYERGGRGNQAVQMIVANPEMMMKAVAGSSSGADVGGNKILVDNLDYKVTEGDLRELFGKVGPVRRATLNYDSRGRSRGKGEVIFSRSGDALKAMEKYNRVPLDGRPMKIEIPVAQPGAAGAAAGQVPMQMPMLVAVPQGGIGRGRRGPGAFPRRRGGRRNMPSRREKGPVSQADLDSEMDKYMQIDDGAAATAPKTE